jgi:hypothetical protein
MKTVSRYAIAACAAAIVSGPPCAAQNVQTVRVVHVVTNSQQTPDVRVETDVDTTTNGAIAEALKAVQDAEPAIREAQETRRKILTNAASSNFFTINTPEMAKKTRDIALLREMLVLKLTRGDIEKAIPLLRELKDSSKAAPVKPEQAMDEEYRLLLEARPGDPMPPSSSHALRDAAGSSRSRRQAIWDKMAQQIGREKANGIRGMLRSEGNGAWSFSSSSNNFFVAPNAVTPFRYNIQVNPPTAPAVPRRKLTAPDAPVTANPVDGDIAPEPARPDDAKPADPAQPRLAPAAPQPPSPDETPAAAARRQAREERAARRNRGAGPPAPGAPPVPAVPNGGGMRFFTFYNQVTVDELIDLFERKLAAMRR